MIDPTDKQTAALPLEQPKRGRGRPSTGQAMTPAEKQRAYRQRLAEQKNNQVPAVTLEKATARAWTRIEQLEQQLAEEKNVIKKLKTDLGGAKEKIDHMKSMLEEEKAISNKFAAELREIKKSNVTENERWAIQRCPKGARKWTEAGAPGYAYENKKWAEDAMSAMQKEAMGTKYRLVKV